MSKAVNVDDLSVVKKYIDDLSAAGGMDDSKYIKAVLNSTGTSFAEVVGGNFNDFTTTSIQELRGTTENPLVNAPVSSSNPLSTGNWFLFVLARDIIFKTQIAVSVRSDYAVKIRNMSNGVWGEWSDIAQTGNAPRFNMRGGNTVAGNMVVVPKNSGYTNREIHIASANGFSICWENVAGVPNKINNCHDVRIYVNNDDDIIMTIHYFDAGAYKISSISTYTVTDPIYILGGYPNPSTQVVITELIDTE